MSDLIEHLRVLGSRLLGAIARALGWRRDPDDTDGDGQAG